MSIVDERCLPCLPLYEHPLVLFSSTFSLSSLLPHVFFFVFFLSLGLFLSTPALPYLTCARPRSDNNTTEGDKESKHGRGSAVKRGITRKMCALLRAPVTDSLISPLQLAVSNSANQGSLIPKTNESGIWVLLFC